MYKRREYHTLKTRLAEPARFIQIVSAPRSVGKTTMLQQVLSDLDCPHFFSSAAQESSGRNGIGVIWEEVRAAKARTPDGRFVLVIDDIEAVPNWTEAVKSEWDRDAFSGTQFHVVIAGGPRILKMRSLTESLCGRFELIRMAQWSYAEMKEAFGVTLPQFIRFGGYPCAASFMEDEPAFREYIRSHVVDSTFVRDIYSDVAVAKPALFNGTFALGASFSGAEESFTSLMKGLDGVSC